MGAPQLTDDRVKTGGVSSRGWVIERLSEGAGTHLTFGFLASVMERATLAVWVVVVPWSRQSSSQLGEAVD